MKNVKDLAVLESSRVKYLGRKGELTAILRSLADLAGEEKRKIGQAANQLKNELENIIEQKYGELKVLIEVGKEEFDITRPGFKTSRGALHPLTRVRMQIENIFEGMGFSVIEGPEAETEYYNFDALNSPANHPARDMVDTFWLKTRKDADQNAEKRGNISVNPVRNNISNGVNQRSNQRKSALLLRTHTSPMQARYMETHQPPLRIIVPGRVFRYEATDASHEIQFYQVEGLMVGKTVSVADFKGVISEFFKKLFIKDVSIRLRPSFFSFTEPSFEVDVSCVKCDQKGCGICGNTGWLEIMGAGMVHPNVFKAVGYNPRDWQGFAFGLGLDRVAMIKYGIDDIRLFYQNDLRFLRQF
ncbi:MAG: phenylalanine--tRNA ligase subunit alpha [bacterium]|nr:phenylalanine--tRNA ligase subunit alpha [bacterium]